MPQEKKPSPQQASGNILIYILGAIFLMGLLVVALKGSFQEGTGIDPEKTAMLVGQVQRYGAELERGVRYVQQNGYSESDIRFAHPNASSAYGLITDIPQRQVFDPQGGGVEWRDPPAGSQVTTTPWFFTGHDRIAWVGTHNKPEITALLQNVTKDFCLQVNALNSINNPSGDAPQDADDINITTPFTGSFTGGGVYMINSTGGYTNFKNEACIKNAAGTSYIYYRVLLAR